MTAWTLYDEALAHRTPYDLVLRASDGRRWPFPVSSWCATVNRSDRALIARCTGPTLDVGCGPGRLVAALAGRGVPALGVDPSPAAVRSTHARGAVALRRSIYDRLPGEGRWNHVLLIDGNIGIGGDVPRLLARVGELLGPAGEALVEVHRSDTHEVLDVRLEHPDGRSGPAWPWARVGLTALRGIAAGTGLRVTGHWRRGGRRFAVLAR
ncbi:MAG: methyltransferase domain-containing protein [Actinobacteria bacterium]|nr:methyltransferase domain-containing protein [Actinomycetota bacterium]